MNKDELLKLGIEEDKVQGILDLFKTTIDGSYVTKARFDEVNGELKQHKTDITKLEQSLETIKESHKDDEKMKTDLENLKIERENDKLAYEKEVKDLKIKHALDKALVNAKNQKAVIPFLNLEEVEIEEDGSIKGLQDQITKLSTDENTNFLFKEVKKDDKKDNFDGFKPADKEGNDKPKAKMTFSEAAEYCEKHGGTISDYLN